VGKFNPGGFDFQQIGDRGKDYFVMPIKADQGIDFVFLFQIDQAGNVKQKNER